MIGDKQQRGFTLMEMVVAVSIFSIVSVVIAQLFITTNRSQQRSGVAQKIQSDARVMMANITDRVRSSVIDYDAYGGAAPGQTETLRLEDEQGRSVIIQKSAQNFADTSCFSENSVPCLEISEDGGATFSSMSAEGLVVQSVNFFLDPPTDPGDAAGPDIQPRITMSLGIESSSLDPAQVGTTFIQTTVSSRVYVR